MVFLPLVKNSGFNASLDNGYALNPTFDSKSIICKKFKKRFCGFYSILETI